MGRSARAAPVPSNQPFQRTGVPRRYRPVTASVSAAASGRSLRSAGSTAARSCPWSSRTVRVRAASVASGPSSRNRPVPWPASQETPSAKRTASRTWSVQWSAEVSCSRVAGAPVRWVTTGTVGACGESPATTVRNSSSMGSMSGEWKACETRSRRVRRPRAATRELTSSTAPRSPATTTARGPLTAATETCPGCAARSGATSSSVASREAMAPPSGSACMSRPRARTRVQASSRENTPATWAAVISPTEWPARWSGVTPKDSTSR